MRNSWPGRSSSLVLALAVLAGCTTGPAASTSPPPAAPTASLAPPTPTPRPSTSAADPTTEPSVDPDATLAPPPVATLVAGGSRHEGEVGSWTWSSGSSDSPWLPAAALDPAAIEAGPLTVRLAGDVEVEEWSARAATASDTLGERLTPLGDGGGEPAFDAPAAGDWVVAVDVRFAGGLGSASYYWFLRVT